MMGKTKYLIYFLLALVSFELVWFGFRFYQLKQKEKAAQKLEEQALASEEQIKQKLKEAPEPEIKEKLASGGKIWFKPEQGKFDSKFELEIWAESRKKISRVDLKVFYPRQFLKLASPDWQGESGLASWSEEGKSRWGRFLLARIAFQPILKGKVKLDFDFSKESLKDCNLLDGQGNDVLEEVKGGEYVVDF